MYICLLDTSSTDTLLALMSILATIIAGLLGGAITYWVFLKQRSRKRISYQILADTPVATFNKQISGVSKMEERLEILFDKKPINDLSIVNLRIINSGDLDLKIWSLEDTDLSRAEYEVPISFHFGNRRVIDWGILEIDPPEQVIEEKDMEAYLPSNVDFTQEKTSVGLPHCILQSGQSITIRVLVTGPEDGISHTGRLFNGKILKTVYTDRRKNLSNLSLAIIWVLTSGLLFAGLTVQWYWEALQRLFNFTDSYGPTILIGQIALVLAALSVLRVLIKK